MDTTHEGNIEFREISVGPWWRKKRTLEYRQCFKGLWSPWKVVVTL